MSERSARRELRSIVRETPLPKDEQLFPELFDGTAENGLQEKLDECICACTELDKIPASVRDSEDGVPAKHILEYVAEQVDEKLEEDLRHFGAREGTPRENYAAFYMLAKGSYTRGMTRHTSYDYGDREYCRGQGWFEKPNPNVSFLNTAENLFGQYAKRQMDILEQVNSKLHEETPSYPLLAVPVVMGLAYLLVCAGFPDWPNFQKMAGLAALAVSGIALFAFVALHDWNNPNSMYKRYQKGEFPVREMVLNIHRSLRYRRILLKRMGKKSRALAQQEKRFQEMRAWD